MPKPQEVAELIVNGVSFQDWTDIRVEHRMADSFHIFDFKAVERKEMPPYWTRLQFKPKDVCEIRLAGQLALSGYITDRMAVYNAESHGVQLIGKSKTWDVARSSVVTKTGNFDGYTWLAIAQSVLAPFGVKVVVRGDLQDEPFKHGVQVAQGETAFAFIERLARMRKILLGVNFDGNLIARRPMSSA